MLLVRTIAIMKCDNEKLEPPPQTTPLLCGFFADNDENLSKRISKSRFFCLFGFSLRELLWGVAGVLPILVIKNIKIIKKNILKNIQNELWIVERDRERINNTESSVST